MIIELGDRVANLVPTMRKPFDGPRGYPAEGPVSENIRDDKTAIELFIAGVCGWEAGLRQQMDAGKLTP
jgi:hypothetical protein